MGSKGSNHGSNEPCKRPDLRKLSQDDLKTALDEHRRWLETEGEKGKRADLSHADLRHADLKDAELTKANLRGACLAGVDLRSTDFSEADLRESDLSTAKMDRCHLNRADLRGAHLNEATLRKADFADAKMREVRFRDADLSDAIDLMQEQLAATDLTRATLPEGFEKFEGLAQVTEISKQARAVFLSSIAACVFSWLTIATTTDLALILNSSSTPLPIIQTKVPIAGFYWAAPLVLLALYVYLHLYLHNLWTRLATLPAVFHDGETLDQKAYPWLLAGIARAHVPIIREDRPTYSRLQILVSIVCAWVLVPSTIFLFWGRYLPRHEWFWTGWLILLLAVSLGFGLDSYRTAARTLRGREWRSVDHHEGVKRLWGRLSATVPRLIPAIVLPVLVARLCVTLAAIAIIGNPYVLPKTVAQFLIANLKEAELSIKSEEWRRQPVKNGKKLPPVKGVDLRGWNLRYVNAEKAFLVRADLQGADLQGAVLEGADLREANLYKAKLQHANLRMADLQNADVAVRRIRSTKTDYGYWQPPDLGYWLSEKIQGTNLQHIDLTMAKLQNAKLGYAQLQNANLFQAELQNAKLQHAKLQHANLQCANLQMAKLQQADLRGANLQDADLFGADLQDANLFWAKLKHANLTGAKLQNARLAGADFQNADLSGNWLQNADLRAAKLKNVNLQNTNLLAVRGLTSQQLDKACGNEKTKLPKYLPNDFELKRCFDEDKVKGILEAHETWLKSGGKRGTKADFSGITVQRIGFSGKSLRLPHFTGNGSRWADFSRNLRHADFSRANLTGANFGAADLRDADFEGTDLQTAKFYDARLGGANLKATDLRGAWGLTQKQLDEACGDENTALPEGLTIKRCPEKSDKPAPPKTAP